MLAERSHLYTDWYKAARCIIPCSGWYEWSSATNTAK
ncbi:SOS response-associated peptidase family protein [Shewanella colwelliana]